MGPGREATIRAQCPLNFFLKSIDCYIPLDSLDISEYPAKNRL